METMKIPACPKHIVHWLCLDASGSWGCGALNDSGDWFQVKWSTLWTPHHIAAKEMVAVVIALAAWGAHWKSSGVLVMNVRQYGCRRRPLLWHSKGPPADALPLLPTLLQCSFPAISCGTVCAWKRDYGSGCPLTGQASRVLLLYSTGGSLGIPLCWKCRYTISQTGAHLAGGVCFAAPWKCTGPLHPKGL